MRSSRSSLAAIAACAAALFVHTRHASADDAFALNCTFNDVGLASVKAGTDELLAKSDVALTDLKINGAPAVNGEFDRTGPSFDRQHLTVENDYNWGKIRVIYRPSADRLAMDVQLINTGSRPLTQMQVSLLQLQFPKVPDGTDWAGRYPVSVNRPDELPVILADWHPGRVAFCRDDTGRDMLAFGLAASGNQPYMLWVGIGQQAIAPGQSRNATVSIRYGKSDAPTAALTQDVSSAFAKKYPSELTWKDRRPIGSAWLATTTAGYKNNPRGWLLDPEIDTTTPAGRDIFKAKMMAYADSVIAHCKMMNAQGVIIWDLEGQEMPHATSYLADPRILDQAAPEMNAIADEFIAKFAAAGLRTGLTIRPTRVARADDGNGWTQKDVSDQTAEIDAKLAYAIKRWGCTIYYIDSNVDFVRDPNGQVTNDPPMPVADFATLARHYPNCLLIPEHKTSAYWACTAPYSEFRLGIASTPSVVRDAYPQAFSVLRVVDGPDLKGPDSIAKLTAAVRGGDILLFRPWWDDPQTTDIKAILDKAASVE